MNRWCHLADMAMHFSRAWALKLSRLKPRDGPWRVGTSRQKPSLDKHTRELSQFDMPPRKEEGNPFLYEMILEARKRTPKEAGFEDVTSDFLTVPYPFSRFSQSAYQNFFDTSNIMGILDGADPRSCRRSVSSISELKIVLQWKELIMEAVAELASGRRKRLFKSLLKYSRRIYDP